MLFSPVHLGGQAIGPTLSFSKHSLSDHSDVLWYVQKVLNLLLGFLSE